MVGITDSPCCRRMVSPVLEVARLAALQWTRPAARFPGSEHAHRRFLGAHDGGNARQQPAAAQRRDHRIDTSADSSRILSPAVALPAMKVIIVERVDESGGACAASSWHLLLAGFRRNWPWSSSCRGVASIAALMRGGFDYQHRTPHAGDPRRALRRAALPALTVQTPSFIGLSTACGFHHAPRTIGPIPIGAAGIRAEII